MKSKTILFLIDTLNTGGAEKSLLEIISRFRMYNPVVCHLYPGEDLKAEYLAHEIEVISLNIPLPYNFRKAIFAVREVVKKVQPCIIHSTLFRADIVARFVARKSNTLLINSLVNNSYHPDRFRKASFMMWLKLKGIQLADALTARSVNLFISNSNAIRLTNARALGISQGKIRVIHRGRDFKKYTHRDEEKVSQIKKELQLEGRKVILNVSRLLERKGQMDLIRACEKIKIQHPEIFVLMVGEGPWRNRLEDEMETLTLQHYIKFLGTRQDVASLLQVADCFVFPSYYEGLPGALIEAMMANLPIVASDIEENLECVDNNSAFIYPVGNVRALCNAINAALTNAVLANYKSLHAYAIAREKFDINAIATQYETCYTELIASS
jgi:glycosyltransferase involved in cell wall biosynthesis